MESLCSRSCVKHVSKHDVLYGHEDDVSKSLTEFYCPLDKMSLMSLVIVLNWRTLRQQVDAGRREQVRIGMFSLLFSS